MTQKIFDILAAHCLKQNQKYLPKLVKTLTCLQSSIGEERLKSAIILLVHRNRDSFYQGFN